VIILRRGDRELVDVPNWDAVTSLPGYASDVDPSSVKLKEIIGSYILPAEVPCGLKCRQPHKRGYVVSTKREIVTNLGNVCGGKHFPDANFEQMRRNFNCDVRMKSYREAITAFKLRIPEIADSVHELRQSEQGADWVHRCLDRFKTPGYGIESVRRTLAAMLKENKPRIVKERPATRDEIETARALGQPIPQYVEEPIGFLAGLKALDDKNDLRAILVVDIGNRLPEMEALDVETASEHTLRREVDWIGDIDNKLEQALDAIVDGVIFLTKRNLRQLESFLWNDSEREAFRAVLRDLPLGDSA
jgi:hypothetical protein